MRYLRSVAGVRPCVVLPRAWLAFAVGAVGVFAASCSSDRSESAGRAAQAVTAGPCVFSPALDKSSTPVALELELPVAATLEGLALATAGGTLILESGAKVLAPGGGFAAVSSVHNSAAPVIAAQAEVGAVFAHLLGPTITGVVHGNVVSPGSIVRSDGGSVLGEVITSSVLELPKRQKLTLNAANAHSGSCTLATGASQSLDANAYGDVAVGAGASLALASGTYSFESLRILPGGALSIDNAAGPVVVLAKSGLRFSGSVTEAAPTKNNVLFATAASAPIEIAGEFRGALVAPHAAVRIETASGAAHVGFVYARAATLAASSALRQRALSTAELCAGSGSCSALCPCGTGGPCGSTEHCREGLACTGATGSALGSCTSPWDDGNPCTADGPGVAGGALHVPLPAGTPCDDSDACNGREVCTAAGVCAPGTPPDLDDGNPCTIDGCAAASGPTHVAAPAGASCSNAIACDGEEKCDGHGGCRVAVVAAIDDGNPCTIDRCDPLTGSVHHDRAPGGRACSDGNLCNGEEICDGAGRCLAGAAPRVDDGDPCTEDRCDAPTGVSHTRQTSAECGAAFVGWESLAPSRPSPREAGAAAFAASSGELVLFGGENAGVLLADTWTYAPATGIWRRVTSNGPGGRAGATATFDSARNRIVLFGGVASSLDVARYLDEVWEFDPALATWAHRGAAGERPPARALSAMAYDSVRARLVLFGGAAEDAYGDTWEWEPAAGTWSRVPTAESPRARYGAALAFDPERQRMVLFGGAPSGASGVSLSDTWEYDGAARTWARVDTTAEPPPRAGHGMVYDVPARRMLVFGGTDTAALNLDDTWEYDAAAHRWRELALGAAPEGRAGHVLFADPGGTVYASLGVDYGLSGLTTREFADVWKLDRARGVWSLRDAELAPAALEKGVAFDPRRGVLVTRSNILGARKATWEFRLDERRWMPSEANEDLSVSNDDPFDVASTSTSPLVYDPRRASTLLLGGTTTLKVREWKGGPWLPRCEFPGTQFAPAGRNGMGFVYDSLNGRVLGFGDFSGDRSILSVNPETCTIGFETPATSTAPTGRGEPALAFDADRNVLIAFGGFRTPSALGDTWEYNLSTRVWTQRSSAGPSVRSAAAMVFDSVRRRAILYGGVQGSTRHRDTWEYDPGPGTWTQLATAAGPPPGDISMTYDGASASPLLATTTGMLWRWTGATWLPLVVSAAPSARSELSGGWIAQRGLAAFFGGSSGDGRRAPLGDVWIWRDGWFLASSFGNNHGPRNWARSSGPPLLRRERAGHTFSVGYVSAGKGIGLLFGGQDSAGLLRDTWQWDDVTYAWSPATTHASLTARARHATALATGRGYVLFGGVSDAGPMNDTWLWTSSGWSSAGSPASSPPARYAHALVADEASGKILLFGGRDATRVFDDTWSFDPNPSVPIAARWQKLSPAARPPARFGHSLTYDSARQRVVLTGGAGVSADRAFGDTWEWDRAAGTWVERRIAPMPARAGHVSFFDASSGKVTVFGGLAHAARGTAAQSFGDTLALRGAAQADTMSLRGDGSLCAGSDECASGQCVDGVCCNSPCAAQCAACNVEGFEGRCVPVQGTPRGGRSACEGAGLCGNECDGSNMAGCSLARAGNVCGGPLGCASGNSIVDLSECDGNGGCVPKTRACAPYACCTAATCGTAVDACRTTCTTNSQCFSSEYFCDRRNSRCLGYARIDRVSVSPNPGSAGAPLTIAVSTLGGFGALEYSLRNDSGIYVRQNCPSSPATPCEWTPSAAGTYQWKVTATRSGSDRAVDDFRDFEVTVVP